MDGKGDPQLLGVPIFVVGSIALGLTLVRYVPAAAGGAALPILLAGTGLGLLIATIWAAQTANPSWPPSSASFSDSGGASQCLFSA